MKPTHAAIVVSCAIATFVLIQSGASPAVGQESSGPTYKSETEWARSLPKDIYPDSRSRFPLVKREDLDEAGKKTYDSHISGEADSLAGLQGPGGLQLYGSRDRAHSGVDRRLQELARLVVAREMDQEFEWTVHEPRALKFGLDPAIIDVIRYRKPLVGVPKKEASIIQMGREIFEKHKVSPDTFARVVNQLGRRDLVDLCDFMGSYATTAILLETVDIRLPYDLKPLLPVP